MAASPYVVEAATEEFKGFVHRPIEQYVIIGHVEMAIVVDPARFDSHLRRDEGREEQWFKFDPIKHDAQAQNVNNQDQQQWHELAKNTELITELISELISELGEATIL